VQQGKLGIKLSQAVVQYVLPDSPAAEGGLQVGDRILEADGKPLMGRNRTDLLLLAGASGTRSQLKIERAGKVSEVTLTRR
jgi:C-terminal processing protease CtpA/Prc